MKAESHPGVYRVDVNRVLRYGERLLVVRCNCKGGRYRLDEQGSRCKHSMEIRQYLMEHTEEMDLIPEPVMLEEEFNYPYAF